MLAKLVKYTDCISVLKADWSDASMLNHEKKENMDKPKW